MKHQVLFNGSEDLCAEPPGTFAPSEWWARQNARSWHRDISPQLTGPLGVLQHDLRANSEAAEPGVAAGRGVGYCQWNVALYDDPTLWLVPGSHRRLNTPEENAALLRYPCEPLPNAVHAKLRPGDGLVCAQPCDPPAGPS